MLKSTCRKICLEHLLDIVAFGSEHTSLSLAVDSAAASLGLVQSEDPFPEEVVFIRSDQYSFVRRGVPAIFLVPGMKSALENVPDGQQFGHFLRDTYHTAKDDMTQSFDWNAAVNFTLANLEIGTIVANADERPTWNREDFFGDKFAGSK